MTMALSAVEMAGIDRDQVARFMALAVPAAECVCPHFGLDPRECVTQAAMLSLFGTVGMHHNWWHIEGQGDDGSYATMVAIPTGQTAGGGFVPQMTVLARYSTPEAAVDAWCKAQVGAR
jgi:hypothetical protein